MHPEIDNSVLPRNVVIHIQLLYNLTQTQNNVVQNYQDFKNFDITMLYKLYYGTHSIKPFSLTRLPFPLPKH